MSYGYIKLHRQIIDWEWYSDINVRLLFLHLMLRVNFQDKNWQGQTICRGQFVTSREKLSSEVGLSVQQTRTALKKLESTGDILIKSTSQNISITICNYSLYQGDLDGEQPAINQQSTSNQPAINQQSTSNQPLLKKDNKDKKEKKEKNDNFIDSSFDEFWETYGRKIDKKKAKLAYEKCLKKYPHEIIIAGTKKYQEKIIREKTEEKFIKHPTTFLNAESFLNEFETNQTSSYYKTAYKTTINENGETIYEPTKEPTEPTGKRTAMLEALRRYAENN